MLSPTGAAGPEHAGRPGHGAQQHSRHICSSFETIRPWEKNPDTYSSGIANSAFVLMERKFAPADDRLRSLIAREKQMPAVFMAARQNLKNPPRVYTEIALEQLPDIISFFENDVPEAFTDAKDPGSRSPSSTRRMPPSSPRCATTSSG